MDGQTDRHTDGPTAQWSDGLTDRQSRVWHATKKRKSNMNEGWRKKNVKEKRKLMN